MTVKTSRRERQILDVLYELGEGSAHDVRDAMDDPPSYSSVRALLARMIEKELITHRSEGNRYIYMPMKKREEASVSALEKLVNTFFQGSPVKAVSALLGSSKQSLSDQELDELEQAIHSIKNNVGPSDRSNKSE
ncbi:BlaI/MecI/CopY family transcriptional regulator [Marinibactrum halimedae]|uniref:BlaI/MecI/CopY family transcriptional regulator n=1 Tax=Marinibactrum halimedae TaxID=1444977 RepID=A0AA37T730_9GAMM|nr:BlaI/MecI/CopY family transcriptional regulator [Marinibactrum halimedae]MCD9458341.1 BlaI/MecI/CopY family transcriptional regulator [Marinibactrum halimedae]GLS27031.1 hypothetical protein GCM10007877_27500 [Marinibactrum halimedae]